MSNIFTVEELELMRGCLDATHDRMMHHHADLKGMDAVEYYDRVLVCESARARVTYLIRSMTADRLRTAS